MGYSVAELRFFEFRDLVTQGEVNIGPGWASRQREEGPSAVPPVGAVDKRKGAP